MKERFPRFIKGTVLKKEKNGSIHTSPVNIQGNFTASDGKPVLGLFTAHDVSNSNVVVIDQAMEDRLRK